MATAGGGWQPAHIKAQLETILSSDGFIRSERLRRFLSFVVEESLSGRADRLKGYTIGIEVFDKDESFDPQLDSSVRVEAGRLRRMLQHYYLTRGQQDTVRIDIPKGAYAPSFEQMAAPQTQPTSPNEEQTQSANDHVLAPPTGPSIAVLPFDNLTGDPNQEYFSDGITEEIISQLARFTDLMVLARHTCFQYKGRPVDVRQLGRELEVHYVLEGSVRRAGDRIRVTAQLLDATNAAHVWSDSYDRHLTAEGLLDIQDDISHRVAATIAEPHGMISSHDFAKTKRKPAGELDAYDAILQWYEFLGRFNPETHGRLRTLMEQVVQKYPDYALAWVALAELILAEYSFGFNPRLYEEPVLERARRMVQRAIDLDRNNPQAFHWLMWVCFELEELEQAIDAGERAIALNPNDAYSLADFGVILWCCGHWERGLRFIEKALLLSPMSPHYSPFILSMDAFRREDFSEAVRIAEGIQQPKFYWTHLVLAIAYAGGRMKDKARSSFATLRELFPECADAPDVELRKRIKVDDLVERMLASLRKAGLYRPSH